MTREPFRRRAMRRVSAKRARMMEVRASVVLDLMLDRGPDCEARVDGVCSDQATDAHELLRRSQGGSPIEPKNIILVCRSCHRWIHDHPAAAVKAGLLKRSWEADNDGD